MGKIGRTKPGARVYKYTEGIGMGGYGFDTVDGCSAGGKYIRSVKNFEGRFSKGDSPNIRWTKELYGEYKYFYETADGEIYDDSDLEYVDDPNE